MYSRCVNGKDWVRIAQLRARIAAFAPHSRRRPQPAAGDDSARVVLGTPADGLLRTRQVAELAEGRGEPTAGPLASLGAALLAAGDFGAAIDAAQLALGHALDRARPHPARSRAS